MVIKPLKTDQESLFSDWRIQSNANNIINLEVSPESLGSALRSCQSSPDVVMKLAKKDNQSVLTFDIQHVASRIYSLYKPCIFADGSVSSV